MTTTSTKILQTAHTFTDFINKSPSPFHAVKEVTARLTAAGFTKLSEKENWTTKVKPNGKYFVTRNQSALVAFAVGGSYKKGNGFNIIGAHTDSPCLKVKPISSIQAHGWLQVGVECYGGGLFHTWFDRDLGVAGRVIVASKDDPNAFESKLVLVNKPILRIPTLAIHLDRESGKGITFNKETHLRPILATEIKAQLEGKKEEGSHHAALLELIASELQVQVTQIRDFELCLFDTQGANTGGVFNEFIFSPRLDNLCCSWLSIEALCKSISSLPSDDNVRVVALFDNEEVGSNSLMGAGSNMLQQTMDRIAGDPFASTTAARKSLLISADMAHGIHPNYSDKHEQNHRPVLHKGPVIKYNANERYATTGETSFLLKELARRNNVPLQEFVVRQDTGCGSTIGPILATSTGIRTIDVGLAQLSMHSIREMCGTDDLEHSLVWFESFFNDFTKLDQSLDAE